MNKHALSNIKHSLQYSCSKEIRWNQNNTGGVCFEHKHYCVDANHYVAQANGEYCDICNGNIQARE